MGLTDERKEYLKQYRKEKLKRVPLDLHADYYERVKNAAALEGTSAIKLIKQILDKELLRLEKKYGIDPKWKIKVITDNKGQRRFIRLPETTPEDMAFGTTRSVGPLKKKIVKDPTGQGYMVAFVREDQETES